jgi:hypothetical protein
MSSHHFVREGQEPALLIVNALSLELAAPLLEWAPHVAVLDTALDEVLAWGIKIDFVLAQSGTEELLADKLWHQHPVRILSYPQSVDLLTKGIELLKEQHDQAVNVMIDDALKAIHRSETWAIPVAFITSDVRWAMIEKGHFEKWFPKGTALLIAPENLLSLSLSGLGKDDNTLRVIEDGVVSVKSGQNFWVGEFL